MTMRPLWIGLCALALLRCGPPPTNTDLCKGRLAGDLVITELMLDPEGTDTGSEWFEVYNTLGTALDLKGMVLFTRDTDGSGAKSHVIRAGSAPAQGYFTFGDVRSGPNPSWIGYSYGDALGSFGNGRGVVGIKCGTTVFDEVTWTKVAKPNRSRSLDPTQPKSSTGNDDETKWCDTQAGAIYFGANAGTPGQPNATCQVEAMVGTCLENGVARPVRPPGPGDLVITEIMANPKVASAVSGEWFEVLATNAVDLNDVTIATPTTDTQIKSMACVPVSTGEYVLFARSSDTFINGNLPTPKLTYSLTLTDSNSRLSLRRGDAGIDEAAYTTAADGIAWQLDSNKLDVAANDDPASFCKATKKWNPLVPDGGTDFGSPGEANEACPFADAGNDGGTDAGDPNSCFDADAGVSRPIVKATTGDFVITEFMPDPVVVGDSSGEWFEVLSNGAADFNGMQMSGNTGLTSVNSSTCLRYPSGALLLFARSADPAINGGIAPVASTFGFDLVQSNGKIVLFTDAGTVDQVTWTTVGAGKSKQLDANKQDSVQNDVLANFCDSVALIALTDGGVGDKGTPGSLNQVCP
jgi:hypothetical protein